MEDNRIAPPRSPLKNRDPFSPERQSEIVETFHRDGFALVPGVFDAAEVRSLRRAVDRVFALPRYAESGNLYSSYIAVRLFETHPIFVELLTHEPLISLAEAIVGADCHLVSENVIRNAPGEAIDAFHVDDTLFFPVAEGMQRHDESLTMPVFVLGFQIALTDILTVENGPTEFIPGSHYAGRTPNDLKQPDFEGRAPVPILCRAGDVYLQNGQCWHRGAPNTSSQTRYLLGVVYGQRFVSQRFYPFIDYRMPRRLLSSADERLRRVLGAHPHGAYG
jgi:hypothetical protein